jgi:hypothetical protein
MAYLKRLVRNKIESLEYVLFDLCFKTAYKIGKHLNVSDYTFRSSIETYIKRPLYRGEVVASPSVSRLGNISLDEALASSDYTVRHDIANKLIVDYSMNLGEVESQHLVRCASVMLEGFLFTPDHIKRLIDVWAKQRNGEIEIQTAVDGAFSEEEAVIFNELNNK